MAWADFYHVQGTGGAGSVELARIFHETASRERREW